MTVLIPISLAGDDLTVLRETLSAQEDPLLDHFKSEGPWEIDDSVLLTIMETVLSEFVETGLDADDEPTDRGLALEHVVTLLNRQRTQFLER